MINKEIPNGFNSFGKVYVVDYDNGEPYEDNFHCINNIFTSREEAEKYLADKGTVKREWTYHEPTWSFPEYICSMNNIDCQDCPKYKGKDENYWDYYDCDEYDERWEREYDNSFYTIEEYDLLTALSNM